MAIPAGKMQSIPAGTLTLDAKWAAHHVHSHSSSSSSSRFLSTDSSNGSSSPDDNDSETTPPPSLSTTGSTMPPSEESLEDAAGRAGKDSHLALVPSAPHLGASPDGGSDGNLLKHSEFGWDANPAYRYTSQHVLGHPLPKPDEEEPSYVVVLLTYVSYIVLIAIGHLRDYFGKRMFPKSYKHLMQSNGYAALNSDFDSFYTRRLKLRLDDCFSRPVTGVCGRTVVCYDRATDDYNQTFRLTGTKTRALNISGYNYLGFAQSQGGCADNVEEVLKRYSVSSFGSRLGSGYLDLQAQTEKLVARFMGTEDAMVVSMGFATNSTSIPAIASPGTLIISDEYNHSSIRFGARLSRAHIRQYKHNNMKQLESLLRECISQGMPRTHRPWKKILVIVEGLYSMEGTFINLPELMRLKNKYKFYLYIDEAHSVGAIGPRGRGVCDYFGVDPRKIDILMGTFTKSFGAAGGYIAGNKAVIDRIRLLNHSNVYGETLSPPVLTQIITSMASIMGVGNHPEEAALLPDWIDLPRPLADGSEGLERLRRLAFNSRYLSTGLRKLGFIVFGHRDSPIVPLLIYLPGKMGSFSRMMLDRNLSLPPDERLVREEKDLSEQERLALEDPASSWSLSGRARPPIVVVVVAYPATPLISSRVRFCVSAAHTKKDIDDVLIACDEVGSVLDLKYQNGGPGGRWTIDQVLARSTELVAWDGKTPI
ncbi:serine palmitoyltransferase component [Tilletia horrida]|nr:serine palmitoyltransferase component [Tilletia horrida]